jgi:glycerophosphoryl diester phosphodiesterase
MSMPTLVAHRGYPGRYPENTLIGIQAAVQAGARYIEFDVQLSLDQVPIICHDDSLKRTSGLDRRVMDMTATELARVDVSEATRFGTLYAGTRPTLLTELAAWLRQQPVVTAFVEIKRESLEYFGTAPVVGKVMRAVQTALPQCVIISFDAPCLLQARDQGAAAIGWAIEDAGRTTVATAVDLAPDYIFVGDKLFASARAVLPGPWRWAVYQVQDPGYARRLMAEGADLIETDAIAEMLAALGSSS